MKSFSILSGAILWCVLLPAYSASGSAPQNEATVPQSSIATSTPAATNQPAPIRSQGRKTDTDNLKAFATNGAKILDSKTGDLTGDGTTDALLVLDPAINGNEKLGEGLSRTVLLLTRDAAGQLQKTAQNDKIVPCAQCGGISGDPYSYSRIAKGEFTIVTEGGSREHWSNEYTFVYSREQKDWLLHEVKRAVADQDTGKQKSFDLMPKDFGVVQFKNFDPSTLSTIELP